MKYLSTFKSISEKSKLNYTEVLLVYQAIQELKDKFPDFPGVLKTPSVTKEDE